MQESEIIELLDENKKLRAAIGKWVDARNAPITGFFGIAQLVDLKKAENELESMFHLLK